jgi:hypothetical protein
MDFTLGKYKQLLLALKEAGYSFYTFAEYCKGLCIGEKYIILRHDVDEMADNALKIGLLEKELGIKATYNFRIVRQSNNPDIIRQIVELDHELGYHYEDVVLANGDFDTAISTFRKNLAYFRTFAPVETVCMHGSSTSAYDNRDLWKKIRLEEEGLLGEPYLSINFNDLFYLTDTGYCWDGKKTAVRDIVETPFENSYHNTDEIIAAIQQKTFPDKVMILAHTLWTDSFVKWNFIFFREFFRNKVKRISRNNAFIRRIYAKFVQIYWKN